MLSYADTVFGGIDAPWGMARDPGGGFLLAQYDANTVSLVRDRNGDGDALDVGEVLVFADGIAGAVSVLGGDWDGDGVPVVSEWCMVAMTLLLLTTGTVILRRCRLAEGA